MGPFASRRSRFSHQRSRWQPSAIRRLLHRRMVWWGTAALLALGTTAATHHLLSSAAAERDRWAERDAVVMATMTIPAGSALTVDNTEVVELPRIAVPERHLRHLPPGSTAATTIEAGEIVHPSRLLGDATRIDDRVAVAVPTGDLDELLGVGDVVDVWAMTDPYYAESDTPSSTRVSRGAPVIDRSEGVALLAVDRDDVSAITAVSSVGTLTLTVVSRTPG